MLISGSNNNNSPVELSISGIVDLLKPFAADELDLLVNINSQSKMIDVATKTNVSLLIKTHLHWRNWISNQKRCLTNYVDWEDFLIEFHR